MFLDTVCREERAEVVLEHYSSWSTCEDDQEVKREIYGKDDHQGKQARPFDSASPLPHPLKEGSYFHAKLRD